jgi:hypothetical protein
VAACREELVAVDRVLATLQVFLPYLEPPIQAEAVEGRHLMAAELELVALAL